MILFYSIDDWANMGYLLARSLQEVGVDAKAIMTKPHLFNYPQRAERVGGFENLKRYLDDAEIVVLMHSNPGLLHISYDLSKKKLAVFHGGSEYRNKPDIINKLFNDKVFVSLTQTGNLLNLGAKNEKWILPPVDTEKIQPVYDSVGCRPIVGHFPRGFDIKGSEVINRVVKKVQGRKDFEYFFSAYQTGWEENLQRMARCDIYISAMKPELNGKPYGGGVEMVDLEAAALGKIVITHFSEINRYREEYGDCELFVANNESDLEGCIIHALNSKKQDREYTREWVVKNHSFKAVGERLRKALEI